MGFRIVDCSMEYGLDTKQSIGQNLGLSGANNNIRINVSIIICSLFTYNDNNNLCLMKREYVLYDYNHLNGIY